MCLRKYKIFPIVFVFQGDKVFNEKNCCICGETNKESPALPCGHIMHSECALKWFEKEMTCPICRENFEYSLH